MQAADVMIDNQTIWEVSKANSVCVRRAVNQYTFPPRAEAEQQPPGDVARPQPCMASWAGRLKMFRWKRPSGGTGAAPCGHPMHTLPKAAWHV